MLKKSSIIALSCAVCSFAVFSVSTFATSTLSTPITLKSVTADMEFLASDDLKGRKIGTLGITQTENYIEQQFKQAGLVPLKSLNSYKQTFNLITFTPKTIEVTLNNELIANSDITFTGALETFNWQQSEVKQQVVAANDDLSAIIKQVNIQGDNTVLLVNSQHKELFQRYQNHFATGVKTTSARKQSALVMILTEQMSITQLAINAVIIKSKQQLNNVIGVIPGTEKPDEFVTFSAHHDHLGTHVLSIEDDATHNLVKPDNIYNGANDDASGVTAVLNLARYYSKHKPKRSIMFVTFTAEESGLLGSSYFINDINSESIIAMLNIEMIGKASEFGPGKFWMTGYERSNLASILNQQLQLNKQQIYADPYPKYRLFYRSDNASLAKVGVPAHSISSTQMSNDHDYHQVSDNLASLDLVQMTDIINAIAFASKPLIDAQQTPSRIEKAIAKPTGLIF
ncbi:M28 family metallopeptidase [Colwelliaceae bacterium BS250]